MKKVIFLLICFCIVLSYNVSAQTSVHKTEKEIELLLDSAAKHMMHFILKKDEKEYHTAIAKATKAKALNEQYKKTIVNDKGLAGKSEKEEELYLEQEIQSYFVPNLKEEILNEKDNSVHYKFKGQGYQVGKNAKSKLDTFSTFLPVN